jgi:hypothetical protein
MPSIGGSSSAPAAAIASISATHPYVAPRSAPRPRLERGGRRHRSRLAGRPQRRDERCGDAEREERHRLQRVHDELRCDAAEIARTQVGTERRQPGARDAMPTRLPAQRRRADQSTGQQRRSELLAHGHAHGVQQRDLAAASGNGQRLRRVDQEAAGEQRDQRERGEVRAIGARQSHGVVAGLAGRRQADTRRQQRAQRGLHRDRIGAGDSSRRSTRSRRPRRSSRHCAVADVEHAERLPVLAGRQQPATRNGTVSSATCTSSVSPTERPKACAAAGLSHTASSASRPLPLRRRRARRREPRLQFCCAERIDADELQAPVATWQPRLRLDDRAGDRDAGHGGQLRVERLVEAEPGRLHRQVGHAEQAARGELHLVGGDAIDQVHRKAERHAERDRHDRKHGASRRLPSGPNAAASSSARRAPNDMRGAATLKAASPAGDARGDPVRVSS